MCDTYTRHSPDHAPLAPRPRFSAQVTLSLICSLRVTGEKPSVLQRQILVDRCLEKTSKQMGEGLHAPRSGFTAAVPTRRNAAGWAHRYMC